ncbi:MAG: aldo/keto reductase [Saprospiraceae bacterium]
MNYQLLGRSGLRVSELCLGTMTFGTEWGTGVDREGSKALFDAYADAGGNFLDTANRYTEGTSERYLGEFIQSERDHFVLATKYTLFDKMGDPNLAGNHRKNMMRSVEESLKRLQTDFIDLLWVHAWDGVTPEEEIMRGLEDLVRSGLVHYIGISDTPAWVVSRANTLAELKNWTAFIGLQVEYSLIQRDAERDLLPMARYLGLTLTPWGALGGGALTGKYLKGESGRVPAESARRSDRANRIAAVVVEEAEKLGVEPGQLALNWTRQSMPGLDVIPIVGARTPQQLKSSMACLNFDVPATTMQALDEVSKIELGFPHDFLAGDRVKDLIFGGTYNKLKR